MLKSKAPMTSAQQRNPFAYAAEVRARPVPCKCKECKRAEKEPVVIRITQNWGK